MRLSESDLISICEKEAKSELTAAKYIVRIDKTVNSLKGESSFDDLRIGSHEWFVKVFDKWQIEVFKGSALKGMQTFRAYLVPIR